MKREINAFVKTLQEKSLRIAFAESITCGLLSEKLANYKGTSDVLAGSVICYDACVKKDLLGVSEQMISRYTCESMEVTAALAKNLRRLISADIHAAITGLAAPGGSETPKKPVGTVFFCFLYKGKLHKLQKRYYGTPRNIRIKATLEMYNFILAKVKD